MKPKKNIDTRVRDYLARAGVHRDFIDWDEDKQAWKYPVSFFGPDTQEDVERYIKMLPLFVPGLMVVGSGLEDCRFTKKNGYVWFTWSWQAMRARYEELLAEYGVADERLAFEECSGKYERKQPSLPGIVKTEPHGTVSNFGERCIFSSYTAYGISQIEHGFALRILHPNRGGLEAIPHSNQRCEVGDEWWLVGSRGDSPEILALEIQASPLEPLVKENLLFNLRNIRSSSSQEESS